MNELTDTHPGKWILVAGPNAVRTTMLTLIARLAERGPVNVLDCGNQFNAYQIARHVRGHVEMLLRISVSRAFTCHQVTSAIEKEACQPMPFIALDFLSTFCDENVNFAERRRLLERCLPHIARLSEKAGGAISIHPPAVMSAGTEFLSAILRTAASEIWTQELPSPAPQPLQLF
jgi:hypothetical protein